MVLYNHQYSAPTYILRSMSKYFARHMLLGFWPWLEFDNTLTVWRMNERPLSQLAQFIKLLTLDDLDVEIDWYWQQSQLVVVGLSLLNRYKQSQILKYLQNPHLKNWSTFIWQRQPARARIIYVLQNDMHVQLLAPASPPTWATQVVET